MSKNKESKPFKKLTIEDVKDLTDAVQKYTDLSVAPRGELKSFNVLGSGCGLCQRYYRKTVCYYRKTVCYECPVAIHAGEWSCDATPWMGDPTELDIGDLLDNAIEGGRLRPLRARARQEAAFLQSLLDNSPA